MTTALELLENHPRYSEESDEQRDRLRAAVNALDVDPFWGDRVDRARVEDALQRQGETLPPGDDDPFGDDPEYPTITALVEAYGLLTEDSHTLRLAEGVTLTEPPPAKPETVVVPPPPENRPRRGRQQRTVSVPRTGLATCEPQSQNEWTGMIVNSHRLDHATKAALFIAGYELGLAARKQHKTFATITRELAHEYMAGKLNVLDKTAKRTMSKAVRSGFLERVDNGRGGRGGAGRARYRARVPDYTQDRKGGQINPPLHDPHSSI